MECGLAFLKAQSDAVSLNLCPSARLRPLHPPVLREELRRQGHRSPEICREGPRLSQEVAQSWESMASGK